MVQIQAIVLVVPEFGARILPNNDKWQGFCHQQVLFNQHCRTLEEAKSGFELWSNCYIDLVYNTQSHTTPTNLSSEGLEYGIGEDSVIEHGHQEEWMIATAMTCSCGNC